MKNPFKRKPKREFVQFEIYRDKTGQIIPYSTEGGQATSDGSGVTMSFAIYNPLYVPPERKRNIEPEHTNEYTHHGGPAGSGTWMNQ